MKYHVVKGYRDARAGLPFNEDYDRWGYVEQCGYEIGRQLFALHKHRYNPERFSEEDCSNWEFELRTTKPSIPV